MELLWTERTDIWVFVWNKRKHHICYTSDHWRPTTNTPLSSLRCSHRVTLVYLCGLHFHSQRNLLRTEPTRQRKENQKHNKKENSQDREEGGQLEYKRVPQSNGWRWPTTEACTSQQHLNEHLLTSNVKEDVWINTSVAVTIHWAQSITQ